MEGALFSGVCDYLQIINSPARNLAEKKMAERTTQRCTCRVTWDRQRGRSGL